MATFYFRKYFDGLITLSRVYWISPTVDSKKHPIPSYFLTRGKTRGLQMRRYQGFEVEETNSANACFVFNGGAIIFPHRSLQ